MADQQAKLLNKHVRTLEVLEETVRKNELLEAQLKALKAKTPEPLAKPKGPDPKIGQLEGEVKHLTERLKMSDADCAKKAKRIAELEKSGAAGEQAAKAAAQSLTETKHALKQTEKFVATLEKKLAAVTAERDAAKKAHGQAVDASAASASEQVATLQEQLAASRKETTTVSAEMGAKLKEMQNKLVVSTELEESARKEKTVAENRLGKAKKANLRLKETIKELEARIKELEKRLKAKGADGGDEGGWNPLAAMLAPDDVDVQPAGGSSMRLKQLERQNARLEQQLDRFEKKAREAEVLWAENRKLREQLDKFQSKSKLLPFQERLNAARGVGKGGNNMGRATSVRGGRRY